MKHIYRRECIKKCIQIALTTPLFGVKNSVFADTLDSNQAQPTDQKPHQIFQFWDVPRWVWLYRPETKEQLKVIYWTDGQLNEKAYREISWFMRDIRFEKMLNNKSTIISNALNQGRITKEQLSPWMLMDPYLIDILYAYSAWLAFYNISKPIVVNSGLRHIITNSMTEGAVKDSEHTKGRAADVIIPNVSVVQIAKFGRWLGGGGVGMYIQKNFVHLDRGRIRTWTKS